MSISGKCTFESLAYEASTLLRLLREHPSDAKLAELCVVILYQTTKPLLTLKENEVPGFDQRVRAGIREKLEALVVNMKKPTASLLLLDSAHNFISSTTEHCDYEVKGITASMDWLIASLLSKSHLRRIFALSSLSCLYLKDEYVESGNNNISLMRLMVWVDAAFLIPKRITDLLAQYGPTSFLRIDIATNLYLRDAMRELERTHDFYRCGVRIANLLMSNDIEVIADGKFSANSGLKITRFAQAIPICARTLSSKKCADNTNQDLADVITAHLYSSYRRSKEAHAIARRAIARGCHYPCFYVILFHNNEDRRECLLLSKRALRLCPQSTASPLYLRLRLTAGILAIQEAMRIAYVMKHDKRDDITIAETEEDVNRKWGLILAFFKSAHEDLRPIVKECNPDWNCYKLAVYLYTKTFFAVNVLDMKEALAEIQVRQISYVSLVDEHLNDNVWFSGFQE